MKNDKPISMLQVSVMSIVTGVMSRYVEPLFEGEIPISIPTIFTVTGACGLYWYYKTQCKYSILFKNLDLGTNKTCYPLLKSKKVTDYSTIYKFTLPSGLCLKDFEDKKEAIEQFAGCEVDIKYTYKEIIIEEFHEKLKENIPYEPVNIKGNVPILAGYDRRMELLSCDLASGEPHVLIAGETGSGKSTVLRAIITNLILKSKVKLHLIDLKSGTEFNVFQKSNKVINFCRTIKEAEQLLDHLSLEVDRRYNIFYDKDVKDIIEYNKKYPKEIMSYEVLIVDEFADLQDNKSCKANLDELGRKARACGIHMILSTQRPDAKVLSGNIKANVTTIIGLKTLNGTNSSIIINETGLEHLRGKGHGIFKRGDKTEFQAPFLDVDKCRELIKHTYIDKKVKHIENEIDFSKVAIFNVDE